MIAGGVALGPSFPHLAPPFGEMNIPLGTLGPGALFEFDSSSIQPLTQQQIDLLVRGEFTLFVHGQVRYTDAFEQGQYLDYRLMKGGPVGMGGNRLAACREGNGTGSLSANT
jgi:hypothetical protein